MESALLAAESDPAAGEESTLASDFVSDFASDWESDFASDFASDPPASDDELAAAFVLVELADERSFFAQPEPLKWTVGVDSALRIVPSVPHDGQNRGPSSLMPWITSVRCRHWEHR
jgi:hypothetical protein